MEIDPVCFKKVDYKNTKWISEYKRRKYYFCGSNCKKTFDENPKSHVDIYHQHLHEIVNEDLRNKLRW